MMTKLDAAMKLLLLALTVLPDRYQEVKKEEDIPDYSWKWAWSELSDEAQEEVKRVRLEIRDFLYEEIFSDLPQEDKPRGPLLA